MTDLNTYISDIKSRPSKPLESLPELKSTEPFAIQHIKEKSAILSENKTPIIEPEFKKNFPKTNQIKESHQSFSLNKMEMVGTIRVDSTLWGLILCDKQLCRVKEGDYLGENNGKIIKINEQKIIVLENSGKTVALVLRTHNEENNGKNYSIE